MADSHNLPTEGHDSTIVVHDRVEEEFTDADNSKIFTPYDHP